MLDSKEKNRALTSEEMAMLPSAERAGILQKRIDENPIAQQNKRFIENYFNGKTMDGVKITADNAKPTEKGYPNIYKLEFRCSGAKAQYTANILHDKEMLDRLLEQVRGDVKQLEARGTHDGKTEKFIRVLKDFAALVNVERGLMIERGPEYFEKKERKNAERMAEGKQLAPLLPKHGRDGITVMVNEEIYYDRM